MHASTGLSLTKVSGVSTESRSSRQRGMFLHRVILDVFADELAGLATFSTSITSDEGIFWSAIFPFSLNYDRKYEIGAAVTL